MRRPRRKPTAELVCRGSGDGIGDALPNRGMHSTSSRKLGIADGRTDALVERLLHWQWPDGGWNCDKHSSADTSSFWESRHPMLGLALHSTRTKNHEAREAATRAEEVFLSRHLFIERHSGRVMNPEFLRLHYPLYHGYDNLGGLQAIAEIGRIDDPRCAERRSVQFRDAIRRHAGHKPGRARRRRACGVFLDGPIGRTRESRLSAGSH